MSYNSTTERLISLKKLSGKAHTSNDKGLANEGLPSGLTLSFNTVFGELINSSPTNTNLYDITDGTVEFVRLQVSFIPGSDTTAGKHGFELKLPADYETNSTNAKKGTAPFVNGQSIQSTRGAIQIIPPSYGDKYEAKPFYGGDDTKGSGTSIPLLDARDWYLDYFNGVFFQQDPTSDANNPTFIEAFIYIGKMLDEVIEEAASSGGSVSPEYIQSLSSGYLSSTGSISFSGDNGYDFNVDDVGTDTFFFVSGSIGGKESGEGVAVFGGDLVVSGNLSVEGVLSNVTLESVANLNLSTAGIVEDSKEIRHQYAVDEYTGSFLSINQLGNLEKRNYKSPVFAQSSDPNSDLFFVVRFPGIEQKIAEKVFKNEFYLGPFQTIISGNLTVENTIAFVHDRNTFETTPILGTSGEYTIPSFSNNTTFIFDSVNNGITYSEVNESLNGNVYLNNEKKRVYGNYLADITSDFNISFFNIYSEFKSIILKDLTNENVINKINTKNEVFSDYTFNPSIFLDSSQYNTPTVGKIEISVNGSLVNANSLTINDLPSLNEVLNANKNFINFPVAKSTYTNASNKDTTSQFNTNQITVKLPSDTSTTNIDFYYNSSSFPYYLDQEIDITREIFSDISSQAFNDFVTGSDTSKYELGQYNLTSPFNSSVKNYNKNQGYVSYEKWKQLFSYYLTNNRADKIKIGTKISINRRDELYKRYQTLSKTDILDYIVSPYIATQTLTPTSPAGSSQQTVYSYSYKSNSPNLSYETSLLGALYTKMCAMHNAIKIYNNLNASNPIPEFISENYPELNWEDYGKIIGSSSVTTKTYPFFPYVRLRYYFVQSIIYNYEKLTEVYESLSTNYPGFSNIDVLFNISTYSSAGTKPYTGPYYNNAGSTTTIQTNVTNKIDFKFKSNSPSTYSTYTFYYDNNISCDSPGNKGSSYSVGAKTGIKGKISEFIKENSIKNSANNASILGPKYYGDKFINFYKVKDYFQDYEEYLYYLSVFNTDIADVTKRDYLNSQNQGKLAANSSGLIGDNDIAKSQIEQRINLRQKLILANKPALLVKGSSAFLGPVSIGQLEGQSPITVNTTFQFGQSTPILDENGNEIINEDGTVLTTNSSLLSLNSKGFEGHLQVTGSVDITGFGRTDGMRINMGNLVMTTEQDGYNMPLFNMINSNSEPFERPQMLLSNNMTGFVPGETVYQMGEITFGGPRDDSPADDQENITIYGQINENVDSQINYLGFDFYINADRNLTGSDGLVPDANKKRQVLILGQIGDDNANNQFGVSTGMGVRGNILPLQVNDNSDLANHILAKDNTLGNDRYRWGGLFLDDDRYIEFGSPLATHSKIGYNRSTYSLEVTGRTRFLTGLTGSLTKLTDGTSYIRGIDGITVTTGSKGEINIARSDYVETVIVDTLDKYVATNLTGSSINVSSGILELANYNDNYLKLYDNGQLLIGGTYDDVVNGQADYYIDQSTNDIYFSFLFEQDDIFSITYHNDTSDDRGQYRYDRVFSVAQPAGSNAWFNFDFNTINRDYEKFDVYYNGQLIQRLPDVDEADQTYSITAYNRLRFDFDIKVGEIVTLIFKIPNPSSVSSGQTGTGTEDDIQTKIKHTYILPQSYLTNTTVTILDIPFDLDLYNKDVLTIYLNGNLLISGTALAVTNGLADYTITGNNTLKFSETINQDDVLVFDLVLPGYDNAFNSTIFLTSNRSLLSNTLKVSGSNGIITETVNTNLVIRNNKELIFNEKLSGISNGINQNFSLLYSPFASNEISIFVNGVLKNPINNSDYSVNGKNIIFSPSSIPPSGSLVMAIYNKVI